MPSGQSAVQDPASTWGWRRELPYIAILAIPFVVAVIAFDWLRAELPTNITADELTWHYGLVRRFAAQWPMMDVRDYPAAMTPLYHLIMASAAQVVGEDLHRLRLVNLIISYAAVLAMYRLLRVALMQRPYRAALSSLCFALVPSFFADSLILMTDNLGWLFCLNFVFHTLAWAKAATGRHLIPMAAYFGLAVLTRQTHLSLILLPPVIALWGSQRSWQRAIVATVALMVAALPYVALCAVWGGPIPPSLVHNHVKGALTMRPAGFFVAGIGLYAPFYLTPALLGRPMASVQKRTKALITTLASIVFLLPAAMAYDPKECFGVLWRFSAMTPTLVGSPLVFWILVPLGMYSFLTSCFPLRRDSLWVPVWALLYAVPYAINPVTAQRYVDPYAIAFHSFAVAGRPEVNPRVADAGLLLLVGLCIAFNCMRFALDL